MVSIALRNRLGGRVGIWPEVERALTGRRGIEIGGPSAIFAGGGLVPAYTLLASLDNCQFASATMWHGSLEDGSPYRFDESKPAGTHFVRDGTDLGGLDDGAYDVVLSSHALEHIANPLRALAEWSRVVGPDGHLLLVVPHVQNTIDRLRPVTTLEHIVEDHELGTAEDDRTHMEEFIALADFDVEPTGTTREAFRRRSEEFAQDRALHHHVFDTRLLVQLLDHAGYRIVAVETALPFHIVALAQAAEGDNGAFLAPDAPWLRQSVFRRDRGEGLPR